MSHFFGGDTLVNVVTNMLCPNFKHVSRNQQSLHVIQRDHYIPYLEVTLPLQKGSHKLTIPPKTGHFNQNCQGYGDRKKPMDTRTMPVSPQRLR